MRLVLLRHVLPILTALALLLLLIFTSDLTIETVERVLAALTWVHIAAFVTISIVLLYLSAVKWRLVMGTLPPPGASIPSLSASFFYTCIGAALSLAFMPHVAMPMGRALGARLHAAQPFARTVGASLLEQVFDLAAIAFFAAFGIAVLLPAALPFVVALVLAGIGTIGLLVARPALLPRRLQDSGVLELLRTNLPLGLATISIVRYLLVGLRAFIIAAPAGITLTPPEFFASFSLVQLSRIVAVTPMGLGIIDWTWAGVLSVFDLPLAVAASFVLLSRSLNLLSTLAALALSAVLSADYRRSAA